MKQWEIYDYDFHPPTGAHPALILTPDASLANPDVYEINVLIVTTVRAGYEPRRNDVMLNGADGLDHLSRVRVPPIYQADKRDLRSLREPLSSMRQKIAAEKIRSIYRLG